MTTIESKALPDLDRRTLPDAAPAPEPAPEPSPRRAPQRPTGTTRAAGRPGALARGPAGVALLTVGIVALAVRLYQIKRSYDIFVDEITYATISRNLATGHGVSAYGVPFDLHPPAGFAILAGLIRAFGLASATPDHLVLDLRPVAAVFGALVVVLLVGLMGRCAVGPGWLLGAALVLGLDPFEILYDSRVMLEAFAQTFVIGAVLGLAVAVTASERHRRAQRIAPVTVMGGLSAGAAFCTKETFGLVLGVTLVAVAALPALRRARRVALQILAIGALCYLGMTVAIWSTSGFHYWWLDHTSGFTRLVGTNQQTGFNSATSVSLVSRLRADAGDLAGTYILLAAGGLATIIQLYRAKPWRAGRYTGPALARLMVLVWSAAACGYLVYATAFGSLEEQMYYITLAPCIASLLLGLESLLAGRTGTLRPALGALLAIVVAFDSASWVRQHTAANDSYQSFFEWERLNLAPGSRIAVTEDVAQFVLEDATIGQWYTLAQLRANQADYVVVNSSLVEQGFSKMTPVTLATLRREAVVAFSVHSDQDGTLYLFDVRSLDGSSG